MSYTKVLALLVCVCLGGAAFAVTVNIAPDRVATVDGKRTFVLGLYENPKDDAVLKQVADAGFTVVFVASEIAALDRLQQFGLHAWVNTGGNIELGEGAASQEEGLRKMVATYASHPAFFTWEVPDEALWNCWWLANGWRADEEPHMQRGKIAALTDTALAEELRARRAEADRLYRRAEFQASEQIADDIWRKLGMESPRPGVNVSDAYERSVKLGDAMRRGYALLKELDPQHPVWMNHAPRNSLDDLKRFAAAADVVGCDIYPVPEFQGGHSDLIDRSLASTGSYTRIMQDSAPGKPVWMVLQGFSWADIEKNPTEESRKKNRRPTFDESRFMAYDAIVNGARGILYWGTAYIEKDSTLWSDLLKVVRELADLQPILSAPDASTQPAIELAPSWGSGQYGLRVLAKQPENAQPCYLVVNESQSPLAYTLSNVTAPNGTQYADATDGRVAEVKEGKLAYSAPGRAVQLLRVRAAQ